MSLRTILVASLCVIGFACERSQNQAGRDTTSLQGKVAPELSLTTLDGKHVTLSDMKGKVVLLDFWATWCPPCRKSLPHIQSLSSDIKLAGSGLVVWAVNAGEEKERVQNFIAENKFTFTVPLGDSDVMNRYQAESIPQTVIVGRDGKVKEIFVGFGEGSDKLIDDAVKSALAEK